MILLIPAELSTVVTMTEMKQRGKLENLSVFNKIPMGFRGSFKHWETHYRVTAL